MKSELKGNYKNKLKCRYKKLLQIIPWFNRWCVQKVHVVGYPVKKKTTSKYEGWLIDK